MNFPQEKPTRRNAVVAQSSRGDTGHHRAFQWQGALHSGAPARQHQPNQAGAPDARIARVALRV
jgi:hypothetical protein